MMTNSRLDRLGDALERAARADLAPRAARAAAAARGRRGRGRDRVPGAALAAERLISSTEDVAQSMPAGTLAPRRHRADLHGRPGGVEYHCVAGEVARRRPRCSDWKGTVEPTVDATQARQRRLPLARPATGASGSATSARRRWQQIIGAGFLGEYAPSPGVG